MPTALVHSGYSRDFEREADTFAFALLKETGRSPRDFASAMRALESVHQAGRKESRLRKKLGLPEARRVPADSTESSKPAEPGSDRDFSYLSTHPATAERIRAAEAAADTGYTR